MELHDATLLGISVKWDTGQVELHLETVDGPVHISVSGLRSLQVSRHLRWGPSGSINAVTRTNDGLEIEMQSGDKIVIVADAQSEVVYVLSPDQGYDKGS